MRIPARVLALSAVAFIALAGYESYTSDAIIPTKGDVPTVGLGSTSYEDGSRVKMGDKITPVRAIRLAGAHIAKEEQIFRNSISDVPLHQGEYDLYMDWIYQYGTGAWVKSSMRRELLAGNYVAACDALLRYKFVQASIAPFLATNAVLAPAIIESAGSTTAGIVVGTGTGAESFEGVALGAICAQGTGAGQMSYQAMTLGTPTYNAGTLTWTWVATRILNNNSGGTIVIGETGVYGYQVTAGVTYMLMRDLLGATVSVLSGGQVTVTYTMTLVFPA